MMKNLLAELTAEFADRSCRNFAQATRRDEGEVRLVAAELLNGLEDDVYAAVLANARARFFSANCSIT